MVGEFTTDDFGDPLLSVPASEDERRFAVFDVASTYSNGSGKTRSEIDAYFSALWAEQVNGGLAAMLQDMLEMNLGNWHPRQVIETAALQDQKLKSAGVYDRMLFSILHGGKMPRKLPDSRTTWVAGATGWTADSTSIAALLYYIARRQPNVRNVSDVGIGMYLSKRAGFTKLRLGWRFPPLGEARADFEKRFGEQTWIGGPDWQVV